MEIVYQDQVEDMTAAMQEVLDKYPQLDGVFCDNADIADLYLDMKKDETKDSIVMVGVDATAKQQEAIRNGKKRSAWFPSSLTRWDIRPSGQHF